MSLGPMDEADDADGDDPNKLTPGTKQRDNYGINSPRKQKGAPRFDEDEDGTSGNGGGSSNDALSSLVTQVDRPDPSAAPGGSSDDDMQKKIQTEQQNSGGFLSCCSCLWSCCSGPQAPEPVAMTSQSAAKAETKKPDPNQSLLSSTQQTTSEAKQSEREDSVSSTEYAGNLLPTLSPENQGKKCLVLDLDETLVHSSFKPIPKPDFIIPVEIDKVVHHVYVLKRPYVDEFLLRASKHYEIVIFTASLSKYADPLLDKLDSQCDIASFVSRIVCDSWHGVCERYEASGQAIEGYDYCRQFATELYVSAMQCCSVCKLV